MSREESDARISRPTSGELRDLLRIIVDEMRELLTWNYPDMRLTKSAVQEAAGTCGAPPPETFSKEK